ncbi:MAG: undecaprenyldiphospho-muramoylpentapeptide beta-N-acetylglucosaminyltransferase [Clostridia bacterium]|nr:undecaprenyldiphospho-muramoylpentapeptide beta-N-acetylglucosaminyltransferase [Clostridia bacterium]
MMKIVLTGGGSAGHVTPNLALVPYLREKGFEISYIGSKTGIEKDIIGRTDIPYFGISSGKLRRYFSLQNFFDPFRIIKGYFEAKKELKKIKPDVLFSKGGYVSVPVVYAAHRLHIPIVTHESDYTPGLANKLSIPKADKICFSFASAAEHVDPKKAVVTGAPVRDTLFTGSREKALEMTRFKDDKPVLLIMGGSLGAQAVNDAVDAIIDWLLERFNIIHIRGKDKLNHDLDGKEGYSQFEYVDNVEDLFSVTDYMISRSGSNAIFEILALRIPNLLIPLPLEASRGDQILNAEYFQKEGYSLVLMQNDITPEIMKNKVEELIEKGPAMKESMGKSDLSNGALNICNVIFETAGI